MTLERIRSAWNARPFVPFTLHLPDGRSVTVSHPEYVSISQDRRIIHVFDRKGAGHYVDVLLISDIETAAPRRTRRSA